LTLEDDESQVRDQITTCIARSVTNWHKKRILKWQAIDKEAQTNMTGNAEENV
jgi:hypothetical protein